MFDITSGSEQPTASNHNAEFHEKSHFLQSYRNLIFYMVLAMSIGDYELWLSVALSASQSRNCSAGTCAGYWNALVPSKFFPGNRKNHTQSTQPYHTAKDFSSITYLGDDLKDCDEEEENRKVKFLQGCKHSEDFRFPLHACCVAAWHYNWRRVNCACHFNTNDISMLSRIECEKCLIKYPYSQTAMQKTLL